MRAESSHSLKSNMRLHKITFQRAADDTATLVPFRNTHRTSKITPVKKCETSMRITTDPLHKHQGQVVDKKKSPNALSDEPKASH